MADDVLKSPFPWFGGKSRIAPQVWEMLGDTPNYVEPFFGSGAMLLARPADHIGKTETVNDKDGFVSNFWRAVQADPEAVAHHADWPVAENDLHARHAWLVTEGASIVAQLEGDPDFYDVKVAGWWVWGICAWIGSGWCSGKGPWQSVDGHLVNVSSTGQGINRQIPHVGDAGQGINRQIPHVGDAGRGRRDYITQTMVELADRLRGVRIISGDWKRAVTSSVTTRHGITGVFLDPPYALEGRASDLYRHEMTVAGEVRDWAVANGDDPKLRIALCGYEHEHTMPEGWTTLRWKARGGYGNGGTRGSANSARETVWLSPHCLTAREEVEVPQLILEGIA